MEGIKIVYYVTLYDNQYKYDDDGVNPFLKDGGEKTKAFLTESCHWKLTNSTCLTFAGRAKALKKDKKIFEIRPTKEGIPRDFQI